MTRSDMAAGDRLPGMLVPGVLALLLAACASTPDKRYVEPAEAGAGSCITACKTERNECRRAAEQVFERCKYIHERMRAERDRCVYGGGTNCIQPDNCGAAPQTRECIAEYDRCFVSCGGRIESGEDRAD